MCGERDEFSGPPFRNAAVSARYNHPPSAITKEKRERERKKTETKCIVNGKNSNRPDRHRAQYAPLGSPGIRARHGRGRCLFSILQYSVLRVRFFALRERRKSTRCVHACGSGGERARPFRNTFVRGGRRAVVCDRDREGDGRGV